MDIPTFHGALADLELYRIFKYVEGMEKVYIDVVEWPRGVSDWLLEAANEYAKQKQEARNRIVYDEPRLRPAPLQMERVDIEELRRQWPVNPE